MFSWILSWLAAFSAMELARKHHEGVHRAILGRLIPNPLHFMPEGVSLAARFLKPQKLRVHNSGTDFINDAYLMSTCQNLSVVCRSVLHVGLLVRSCCILCYYGICCYCYTHDNGRRRLAGIAKTVEMEVRATTDNLMEFTRLGAASLRY